MITGYYTGFSINKFLKILSNGYVAGIFGIVLSHIVADIIACYLDPDLRKMIFSSSYWWYNSSFFHTNTREVCSKK